MSKLGVFSATFAASACVLCCPVSAHAATDCHFSVHGDAMTLGGDCTTDSTLFVPEGLTLRGRGFTITAVDPAGGHFVGAVVQNAGSVANVYNVRITTRDLAEVCDVRNLRGIELLGASGSIIGNVISNLNQAHGHGGCQEGNGITVQSFGTAERVRIEANVVEAYQKTGIVLSGDVRAVVRANAVIGFGPVDFIAQNGIQIGFGADATIEANVVTGNSYTGTAGRVEASGILVVGGPTLSGCSVMPCPYTTGLRIRRNLLLENDVGVLLSNPADAAGTAPPSPTDNVVEHNAIFKSSLTNGSATQVGIFDIGNGDRIIGNTISGRGYDPALNPSAFVQRIFADPPFAQNPVIRNNHLLP